MKTGLAVVFLGQLSTICSSSTRVQLPGCKPGKLVCHGESQYGLCDIDNTVSFMNTARGTSCVCSGTECSIIFTTNSDTEASALPSSQQNPGPNAPSRNSQETSSLSASQPSDVPTTTFDSASSVGISGNGPVDAGVTNSQPPSSTDMAAPSSTSSQPEQGSGDAESGDYIKTFFGNGEPSSGWPELAQWVSFDTMWATNLKKVIFQSCPAGQTNSASESADVKSAIKNVAESSGVDERFILAVALQESGCCVRAPTTIGSVSNPGIMQSHDGTHSCYKKERCPRDIIQGMIADGVTGTPSGDGLAQILGKVGGSGVSRYYKAARMYNSGSIDASGLLEEGGSTHCYASDIANRLIGWSQGSTGCKIIVA
ncbi:Lysozyme-like domain protein [Cordyceps fumosorosea ARSEF 2679]|uniref:Lysozyme-like domain protein n=1 Tax=Cordyceps fumosorosea (strain ARSEF 2679) TaxID=1081104 RepID=A0A167EV96_CORFA|nr:Lysozyme-like domain protein [Cordyceps fumosorosea ARSEF 2679]OAA44436.1 Lysozyme-like domain protein [Cordyceps fumosorosea ARSEF 2679]